jgi:hypothetical protein
VSIYSALSLTLFCLCVKKGILTLVISVELSLKVKNVTTNIYPVTAIFLVS